ncbi:MAG: RsmB/NOP family class I SAM-dependent RNA methyltransferase, partial [Rhodospirillales bacterium]|nr:RsmB/NOP family class I SAM-dependent RNA methyltransferase [Rhodospirillales bacterium]
LQGSLTACDIFSRRLARIKPRLERAGAAAVVQKVLVSEDDPWVIENKNTADRVLLDVPCSATGTWRRTPLAKWQLKPVDLEELILTQRRILASASTLVKPGGRLIYATCSILAEENENQIDWFQQQTDDFQVLNGNEIWQQSIGSIAPPTNGPYMRLTPASTQTDGFFCAVLERIK